MKKIAWCLSVALFFVLSPFPVSAEISVTLKLDRKEATLSDVIKMVVNISGPRNTESHPILDSQESDYLGGTDKFFGSDTRPILNGLESFDIAPGETSTDLVVSDGDLSARVDHIYLIYPKKIGTFQIGPAEVAIEGKTFQSNTATLTITEQPRSSDVEREVLPFRELSEGMAKLHHRSSDVDYETLIFLRAELSTAKVYLEEQVIYTLKLFRKARLSDIDLDLPETEYVTFKQLGNQREYESVYNGQEYKVLEVRHALIPSKAGTLRIPPARMTMTVYPPGEADRGTFDTPIYALTTGIENAVESEPLELEVLPLPEDQRPNDFSGLVGSFQIDSQLEPPTIKAGESTILTVFLRGRGNVDRIPDLKLPKLEQTKVYPDQAVLKIEPDAKGLTASKTMRWALVPEKEGHYEIPPLSISFFDTETQKYRVLKTPHHSLSVLAGGKVQGPADGEEEGTTGAALKHAVRELGRDILPVRGSVEDLTTGFRVRPDGLTCWVILLAPLFVYVGTFWRLKSRNRSESAIATIKAKRAAKKLVRECRQAGLSSNDLILSIRNYLNERFGLFVGTLTPAEAAEILESRGVSIETAKKLRKLIGGLEDAVYTGKGHEASEMGKDIPKLVKQIEREIR
jgi:hypothetical protein